MPKELVVREPSLKKRLHGKRLAASRMLRFGRVEQAKEFCAEHRIEFPPWGRYDFITDPPRVQQTAGPLGQKTPEQIHAELVKLSGGGVAAPQTNTTSLDTEAIMKDVDTSSLDPFRSDNLVAPGREASPPDAVLESGTGPLGSDIPPPKEYGIFNCTMEGNVIVNPIVPRGTFEETPPPRQSWSVKEMERLVDESVQVDPPPEPQIVTQANDLPPAVPTSPVPEKAIRRARIHKFCMNPRLAGIRFTEPPYEFGSMFINRVGLQLDEMVDVVVEQGSGAAAIYAEVRRRV